MNYKTHTLGGIATGIILNSTLFNTTSTITKATVLSYCILGSLLPDLDHTQSYLGKRNKIISKPINLLAGHRGILHSPFLYLILAFVLYKRIPVLLVISLLGGIFSHLLLDMFNKGGIPIFYPLSKKRYKLFEIKVNSFGEVIFDVILLCLIFYNLLNKSL